MTLTQKYWIYQICRQQTPLLKEVLADFRLCPGLTDDIDAPQLGLSGSGEIGC